MAAPKAKTQIELFGFKDTDLVKPEHDQIILWLDRNMPDILMLVLQLDARPKEVFTDMEPVVQDAHNKPLGHIDLYAYYELGKASGRCVFEAKTEIKSLGELLRQVRFYQQGRVHDRSVNGMPVVIVSPDDRFADDLARQRVRFLKYDPAMSFTFLGGI